MRAPWLGKMPRGNTLRHYGGTPTLGAWEKKQRRFVLQCQGKTYKVARLICEAFHGPAPEDQPNVLHGDEDSSNNRPDNLSWGTQKENLNAPGFIAYCQARTGANSTHAKRLRKLEV